MTDWTTVWVALITGSAGVLAGLGGAWLQVRAGTRQRAAELERHSWEERRDAYIELFGAIEHLQAAASGARASGVRMETEDQVHRFTTAKTRAEFFAPASVWREMTPLVDAVTLRANSVTGLADPATRAEIAERLRELDARTSEGFERLWQRYLEAARADLGAR